MNTFGKWLFALCSNVGLALWATGFRPGSDVPEGPRPALHPDKMRLVDESGAQLLARNARPAAAGKTEAGGCYRIGPFADAAQADKASAVLKEIPLAYERRAEEQTVVTGYRVYLPPLPTRDTAEKKRRELSRLGFKDSSVMQEAGMENALSLGLFTVKANAQKHLQALAAKKSTPGCRRSRRRGRSIGSISGRSRARPTCCRDCGLPTGAAPRPRRKRHRASRHRRRLCPPVERAA